MSQIEIEEKYQQLLEASKKAVEFVRGQYVYCDSEEIEELEKLILTFQKK